MNVLISILLVLFVIVSILLVFLISLQDEKQSGLSGVFGGRGGSAFGSQTSSVVTKITSFFAVLFFGLSIALTIFTKRANSLDDDPLINQPSAVVNQIAPEAEGTTVNQIAPEAEGAAVQEAPAKQE